MFSAPTLSLSASLIVSLLSRYAILVIGAVIGTVIVCAAHKAVHLVLVQIYQTHITFAVLVKNIIYAIVAI